MARTIIAECFGCGKITKRLRSKRPDGSLSDKIFCTRACYDNNRKPKPTFCVNCGCFFCAIKPMQGRFVAVSGNKMCSRECYFSWLHNIEKQRYQHGSHPSWQGGKTALNDKTYRGPDWKYIRERALRRDKYCCVDCGMTRDEHKEKYGCDLHVDHEIPFHNFIKYKEANRLSNLKSRCMSCHKAVEHKRSGAQMILPLGGDCSGHRGMSCGERHYNSKLKEYQVRKIIELHRDGMRGIDLAVKFDVSPSAINGIVRRRRWKHISV